MSNDSLKNDIRQSLEDIENGRFIEFGSIAEFKEKLNKYSD